MYWLPKIHKTPTGSSLGLTSKTCSTKNLSNTVSKVFEMIHNRVENIYNKSRFYSNFKKYWVVQNSFLIIKALNANNKCKEVKTSSTFDLSTLYTTIPGNLLIKVLSETQKLRRVVENFRL